MLGEIWEVCQVLADAQYEPTLNFFLEGLSDPDWDWRQRCLQLIAFHYTFPSESEITEEIRKMLTSDPDDNVRMTAANVLGKVSTLPNQALVNALASDSDWFVRRSAYFALLQLAGVSYEVYLRENERFDFESEEPEPILQDLKRILTKEGIEVPPETF